MTGRSVKGRGYTDEVQIERVSAMPNTGTRMNYPDFDDARSQFVAFLTSCGHPGDPLWLTRDDVAVVAGNLFVNPPADSGERRARERYEPRECAGVSALKTSLRRHIEDPDTLVVSHLFFQAWGRKSG